MESFRLPVLATALQKQNAKEDYHRAAKCIDLNRPGSLGTNNKIVEGYVGFSDFLHFVANLSHLGS